MPTYEYVCQSCGTHIEVFQRFSDEPLTECGVCGGPLRKVFHPAGILFKGPGFYSTDSRVKAGASKSRSDKSDSSGESPSTDVGSVKSDKSDKSEQSEQSEKSQKSEKSEKSESPGKPDKPATSSKKEKTA